MRLTLFVLSFIPAAVFGAKECLPDGGNNFAVDWADTENCIKINPKNPFKVQKNKTECFDECKKIPECLYADYNYKALRRNIEGEPCYMYKGTCAKVFNKKRRVIKCDGADWIPSKRGNCTLEKVGWEVEHDEVKTPLCKPMNSSQTERSECAFECETNIGCTYADFRPNVGQTETKKARQEGQCRLFKGICGKIPSQREKIKRDKDDSTVVVRSHKRTTVKCDSDWAPPVTRGICKKETIKTKQRIKETDTCKKIGKTKMRNKFSCINLCETSEGCVALDFEPGKKGFCNRYRGNDCSATETSDTRDSITCEHTLSAYGRCSSDPVNDKDFVVDDESDVNCTKIDNTYPISEKKTPNERRDWCVQKCTETTECSYAQYNPQTGECTLFTGTCSKKLFVNRVSTKDDRATITCDKPWKPSKHSRCNIETGTTNDAYDDGATECALLATVFTFGKDIQDGERLIRCRTQCETRDNCAYFDFTKYGGNPTKRKGNCRLFSGTCTPEPSSTRKSMGCTVGSDL